MNEEIINKIIEPQWMKEIRMGAWNKFQQISMPTIKDEDWKYTDISSLDLTKINPSTINKIMFEISDKLKKSGVIITDLRDAIENHEELVKKYFGSVVTPDKKFDYLNFAFWNNGIFIYVPESVSVDIPIRAAFLTKDVSAIFTHNLIILEPNSSINFYEEYSSNASDKQSLQSGVTEIIVKENSHIDFVSIQEWNDNFYDFSTKKAILERDATINWIFGCFGGRVTKWNINTMLNGEGSQSRNLGVFFGTKKQHFDISTNAYHLVPHTTNNILTKGVLNDNATSVYHGLISVEKDAQKTDSYLADHILVLSENALANSIPELKIEANDVRATHGATIGKIDEEQLFYLTSRGLSRNEAELLIVKGFFEPVIQKIPMEDIRDKIQKIIEGKMNV